MVEVNLSGPLFDGSAPSVFVRMADDCATEVAAQGYAYVMTNLNASIRHPTPYYETQITVDRVGRDRRIHDRGVVYGNWLEGTGSRNKTTRFKGYASFRRAKQQLDADVPRLVAAVVTRHLQELRG